ncbi:MAG: type 4a pilus biogenesis protein PilO [Clostridia bacterium]|nr:type 4a pilus biogenesis protein PilO [Clostridia bacterium]
MRKLMSRNYTKKHSGKTNGRNLRNDTRGISTLDIIITIVAGIIIIVSVILLISNVVKLRKVNEEIEEIKATLQEKEDTLNKLIELGQNEDVLRETYDRNLLFIPNERDEVGITADMTHIMQESDVSFRRINFSTEITLENGTIDIPFVVRVNCTYDKLNMIIDKITKTDRLYIIESVEIIDSNSATEELDADLTIHAYYRKD